MRGLFGIGLFVFFVLLLLPSSLAVQADDLRARYALTLINISGNQDYMIECGGADALTNSQLLPTLPGYLNDPAVCSLNMGEGRKAVVFSLDAAEPRSNVIDHFDEYYNQEIDDDDHILTSELILDACDNGELLASNWSRCDNPVQEHNVKLYYKLGEPMTYLVTYGFTPNIERTVWRAIVDFFRNLFGFSAEPQDIEAFTRGYFARATGDGSREIQGLYHAQNLHAHGEALIIFKNFGFDVRELANGDYQLGTDNRQVLRFDDLSPAEWKALTARLRIEPDGSPPLPGGVCGDGVIDFGEDCEGTLTESCTEHGFAIGEVSCTDCARDLSDCRGCTDEDGDGYFVLAECAEAHLDCDDTNATINPNATEICGDGIDNNCDGFANETCNVITCNLDGICDENENETCDDCQEAESTCPSQQILMHKQGAYEFSAYITTNGAPQILIKHDGVTREDGTSGKACDGNAQNDDFDAPMFTPAINYNPFDQSQGQVSLLFRNGGGDAATVNLVRVAGGYQIQFIDQGSETSERCWGASGTGLLGPVMNPLDYVSCNHQGCQNSFDCGAGAVCFAFDEEQLLKTCIPNPFFQCSNCRPDEVCSEFGRCVPRHQ